jgi:glycerol uptake facilitator-like aquaporin
MSLYVSWCLPLLPSLSLLSVCTLQKKAGMPATKPSQAVMFLIGQLSGSVMGALLVCAAIPEAKKSTHNVGLPELGDNVKPAEAFLCEVILTFMLTFVFFVAYPAYITSGSGFHSQRNNAPMAVGFTITVCYFAGFAISGSCMNPARSYGETFSLARSL